MMKINMTRFLLNTMLMKIICISHKRKIKIDKKNGNLLGQDNLVPKN